MTGAWWFVYLYIITYLSPWLVSLLIYYIIAIFGWYMLLFLCVSFLFILSEFYAGGFLGAEL